MCVIQSGWGAHSGVKTVKLSMRDLQVVHVRNSLVSKMMTNTQWNPREIVQTSENGNPESRSVEIHNSLASPRTSTLVKATPDSGQNDFLRELQKIFRFGYLLKQAAEERTILTGLVNCIDNHSQNNREKQFTAQSGH